MLRSALLDTLRNAVEACVAAGELPAAALSIPLELSDTKCPEHGDYAFNYALAASKAIGRPPREIAELLRPRLEASALALAVEVAGPGFLNVRLNPSAVSGTVPTILALGAHGLPRQAPTEHPLRINLEFVSVNPNGPITVGSARGAAYGDALASVLQAAGHTVDREYYINDGVNSEQMRLFGESVGFYLGLAPEMPEGGYKGDYVERIAATIKESGAAQFTPEQVRFAAEKLMLNTHRTDLGAFGVSYDAWFSEQALHEDGTVASTIERVKSLGAADDRPVRTEISTENSERVATSVPQEPGPIWFRSSKFGDDKDRVLVRTDGRPAYIAGDLAYMQDKLGRRGYDKAIIVLGPDHHGYIGRMNAVCIALGFPAEKFEIVIFQIVRFVKDGQPAPMRKRDGNIYELRDLMIQLGGGEDDESMRRGTDVARFFYLMRSHDTHLDFDIDLATKQTDDNPVFYVQYAHARICSVVDKAKVDLPDLGLASDVDLTELVDPRELALIKKILDLPFEVARCADDYGVHRLTTFAVELARTYHHFYDACRVIQADNLPLTRARVAVCKAAQVGLQGTLGLLGISAPERMVYDELTDVSFAMRAASGDQFVQGTNDT